MNSTIALAQRFEASASGTRKISEKAAVVAVSATSAQSKISKEIAVLADMMTSLSTRIASTLRASVQRDQEAA